MSDSKQAGYAGLYVPERLTHRAPHVRSELATSSVMQCVVLAALPCVAMALYNTGFQVNDALAGGANPLDDWRLALLSALGVEASPASPWACVARGALHFVPLLGASLLAALLAEDLFARLRGRPADHAALSVIALLFTLCLPPTLPVWKAALGSALAIIVGKEIFGGLGRNVTNPPLTGLALLYFAYPGDLTGREVWVAVDGFSGATPLARLSSSAIGAAGAVGPDWWSLLIGRVPGAMGATSTLACGIGAVFLVGAGVASWRVLAGGIAGLAAGVWLLEILGASGSDSLPWTWHAISGGFAFGLVFLATDPVTSAATNPGRLLYGALIGVLVVVIRVANPAHREGVMLAILLGNVAAPLIDQIVARIQRLRRGGGDG